MLIGHIYPNFSRALKSDNSTKTKRSTQKELKGSFGSVTIENIALNMILHIMKGISVVPNLKMLLSFIILQIKNKSRKKSSRL